MPGGIPLKAKRMFTDITDASMVAALDSVGRFRECRCSLCHLLIHLSWRRRKRAMRPTPK